MPDQISRRKRTQSQPINGPPSPVIFEQSPTSLAEITLQYSNHNYDEEPDFQERTVMAYFGASRPSNVPRSAQFAPMTSSMAPSHTTSRRMSDSTPSQYSVSSQYPASRYSVSARDSRAPSLRSDISTAASTRSSVVLNRHAENIARTGPFDQDGFHRAENRPCDFTFLGCPVQPPVGAAWHTHSRCHLGAAIPPTEVCCPVVNCTWAGRYTRGEEAWTQRSAHIESEHSSPSDWRQGWKKPARDLIQHLFRNGIILPEQCRDLIQYGRVRASSYSISHGVREDRRREPRYQGRHQYYPPG